MSRGRRKRSNVKNKHKNVKKGVGVYTVTNAHMHHSTRVLCDKSKGVCDKLRFGWVKYETDELHDPKPTRPNENS